MGSWAEPAAGVGRRAALRAAVVGLAGLPVAAASTAATAAGAAPVPWRWAAWTARQPVHPASPPRVLPRRTVIRTPPAPPAPLLDLSVPHLLRRTTFGVTPALLAQVTAAGGASGWLEAQLAPASLSDSGCDQALARWPLAQAKAPQIHAALTFGDYDAAYQLVEATLARQIWSQRQLFEVMVEFWSNHLNITTPSSEVWATKPWDDVAVIRAHALGRFDDMLVASMTSPAMLLYLNAAESTAAAPNENHGRELLELHTVGVDAGYAHSDILDAARALTGLSVWNPWNGGEAANLGTLNYVDSRHYVGALTVLGWTHPNATRSGGRAVAESLGRYLATHPATAHRIATKLAIRFVSDTPPASLISRLASVYLSSGTAIVPMLRELFSSPEFAASALQKVRRPNEDLIASVRAMGVQPAVSTAREGVRHYMWSLWELGAAPLGWGLPDGYPDTAACWTGAGTMLGRWSANEAVAEGWATEGLTVPSNLSRELLGTRPPTSRGALIDALHDRLLPGQPVPVTQRRALLAFLDGDGPVADGDLTWKFAPLVGLILNSPLWSRR